MKENPAKENPAQEDKKPAQGRPAAKRRRIRRSTRRVLFLFLALAALLGLAGILTALLQLWQKDPAQVPPPSISRQPGLGAGSGSAQQGALAGMDTLSWNFVGPVRQEAEDAAPFRPNLQQIALAENGRIDFAYFNNTVFVGDSITLGLQQFGHIAGAKFCAYVGVGPREIYDGTLRTRLDGEQEVPMETLVSYQPDNVYILLGTNAMISLSDEALLTYYAELLDEMRQQLGSEVGFYLQAIPPVVQGVDDRFELARIQSLNEQLAQLAFEKDMYFVNLSEVLAGEDGWLPPEYGSAADGYHLTGPGYAAWVEYLVTHTAYHPRHALYYLEGSPYYTAASG